MAVGYKVITKKNFNKIIVGEHVSCVNNKHCYHIVNGELMITVKLNFVSEIGLAKDFPKLKLFSNIYDTKGNRLDDNFEYNGKNVNGERGFYKNSKPDLSIRMRYKKITEENFNTLECGELVTNVGYRHTYQIVNNNKILTVRNNIVRSYENAIEYPKNNLYSNIFDINGNKVNVGFQIINKEVC